MNEVFVAIDVEATGMDPSRDEIIEVAVVVFDADRELERFESLVKPRGKVSLDIASLTGITPKALADAPSWAAVSAEVRRLLDGKSIVGQSVEFDVAMLQASGLIVRGPVFDTYALATLLLHDLPSYTLTGIATALGVPVMASHRAIADAEMAAAVFRALLQRIDRFDGLTLDYLAAMTRMAHMPEAALFASAAASRPTGPLFDQTTGLSGSHELAFLTQRDRPESLRSSGSRDRTPDSEVDALLAPKGPFSTIVPGFERRAQQLRMAKAVNAALNHDGQLLVEAGTGTGKSLAYLVPAALFARERNEPVVISTNTLALQDQLFKKDLPNLKLALGIGEDDASLTASVLKGRSNYLCLRQWFQWQRLPPLGPHEASLRAKIAAWAGATETGDRAELRLTPDEDAGWRHVAEEEGACVASRCVFHQRNQCFLYRARRRAEGAHLVIVNHALLLSDVVAGSRILPGYDRLIIDEAHHLEEQATSQFGFTVGERDINELLGNVLRLDGAILGGILATVSAFLQRLATVADDKQRALASVERLQQTLPLMTSIETGATRLFARLLEVVSMQNRSASERSIRLTPGVRNTIDWLDVENLWEPVDGAMRLLDAELRWFDAALAALDIPAAVLDPDNADELQREELGIEIGLAVRAAAELGMQLQAALSNPDEEMVYWVERNSTGERATVHSAPLRVGDLLRQRLFDEQKTVVLTSATLTTDGSFDYFAGRIGLEGARTLSVASPFDYERSTLLYLADDIPEPNAPGYQRMLDQTLIDACIATGGRALILFTSHAALQATARAIKGPLEKRGILTLAQRTDGSPRQLVERLRHGSNLVVLGTSTFWEGVDISGQALSLLVITKLPFSVPSDPVFAARSELFDDPFGEYAVPQAVLKFKQGFGRLIRSSQDRGVCAVLDRRVLSRRYGSSFIESLPPCSVQTGPGYDLGPAAANWLGLDSGNKSLGSNGLGW